MQPKDAAEDIIIAGAGLAGLAAALGLHRKGVRTEERGAGVVADAARVGVRVHDMDERLPRPRRPRRWGQDQEAASSGPGVTGHRFCYRRNRARSRPHAVGETRAQRDPLRQARLAAAGLGGGATKRHHPLLLQDRLDRGGWRHQDPSTSQWLSPESKGNPISLVFFFQSLAYSKFQATTCYSRLRCSSRRPLQMQVLIGCDGINSVVAKWLGLAKPSYSGRSAARGFAHYPDGHGFEPKFLQFVGDGFRAGMLPCNQTDIYWFFTWTPSEHDKGVDESAAKMKQFVLDKLRGSKVPEEALAVIAKSEMSDVLAAPLRFRPPLSLVTASINKGNVCVAGDALHPMTPDLGQGGCSALEDGVVLARCLGEALVGDSAAAENERIDAGLREYARIRRWRSVELIATAYTIGFIQESNHAIVSFLRDKFLSGVLAGRLLKMADYDCGTLSN
ncbi:unnamed protein product [Urochloa decumbens]|uniref:FAD-binding domain-containing protein n=1 Tax=Urochloa decumbens TaxID=240449 RepID=A0ABC8Y8E8_9POAL